ncbi:M48 family metallopeptidase [Sphingomonas sp. LY54]|uniref:M48 family metallopeptidase n=1 Tax=Sphingomonas sp. LY54 TaxID=3095343 RepID=UPI002D776AE4|nr:M48 family metallopeptidase [Sphingomonas sp. LY54]WRP27566.1 M48 family metallopeptidase [Sphingomonas sp. LY54]
MTRAVIAISAFMLWSSAAATQIQLHDDAVQTADSPSFVRADDYRVAEVGFRIARQGLALCVRTAPAAGLLLHHLGEYAVADRDDAVARFGLDRGPGVLAVVAGGPAAQAGLRAGDVLLTANAVPFSYAPDKGDEDRDDAPRRGIEALEQRLELQLAGGPVRLDLLRDGRPATATITAVPACPARVRLARSSQLNAFARRGYAIVTTRMLDYLQSDDELAIVLGHEMAHVILGHPEQLDAAGVPRGLLRHFGKNASRVKATEIEADRLGLRLAWAAGYDISAAVPFWRRYAARVGPHFATTHPGLKAREKIIAETIAELGASQSRPQRP